VTNTSVRFLHLSFWSQMANCKCPYCKQEGEYHCSSCRVCRCCNSFICYSCGKCDECVDPICNKCDKCPECTGYFKVCEWCDECEKCVGPVCSECVRCAECSWGGEKICRDCGKCDKCDSPGCGCQPKGLKNVMATLSVQIKRLGSRSAIGKLPVDMWRMVKAFSCKQK
jgi:hypothetical protein